MKRIFFLKRTFFRMKTFTSVDQSLSKPSYHIDGLGIAQIPNDKDIGSIDRSANNLTQSCSIHQSIIWSANQVTTLTFLIFHRFQTYSGHLSIDRSAKNLTKSCGDHQSINRSANQVTNNFLES